VGEQRLWGFSSHNDLLLQKKSRVLFLREEACEGGITAGSDVEEQIRSIGGREMFPCVPWSRRNGEAVRAVGAVVVPSVTCRMF
jgi:hypothetical protein